MEENAEQSTNTSWINPEHVPASVKVQRLREKVDAIEIPETDHPHAKGLAQIKDVLGFFADVLYTDILIQDTNNNVPGQ